MWGFIDWGNQEHQLCLVDATGQVVVQRRVCQSAPALAELCAVLREAEAAGTALQGVGIERTDGPVVDALQEAGFAVWAINPKQLDRFRAFLAPSGGKDDQLDAYVGAEALRQHPESFTRLAPPEAWQVLLRDQVRLRAEVVQQQVRLRNRAREQLQRYFPQFLELGDLDTRWQLRLWQRVPTPAAARRVRTTTIATLLRAHRVRRYSAADVLQVLRQPALVVAAGVVDGAVGRLQYLLAELALADEQHVQCSEVLERLLEQRQAQEQAELAEGEPTDVELLRQLPGFGTLVVATLYAEAPAALRARDLQALRSRTGVAPVSRLSGKQQNRYAPRHKATVWMRHACSQPLREVLFHAARAAMVNSRFYKARYQAFRQRGHTHGRACRQLGDHLLRVMMSCLRHRQPFSPERLEPTPT